MIKLFRFFPAEAPDNPSDHLKSMRIRDLLRMTTGHDKGTLRRIYNQPDWVRAFLTLEVEHKPGTHFLYNTGATYMLSAIIQKITNTTMMTYLQPRLFEPLGIVNPSWESDPQGINVGGYGLSVTTEDISKLGQLYLQEGNWNGKQLVSKEWIREATSIQTSNGSNPDSDWEQGYGYQFWRCRYNLYRGDGAFGQFCIVMPEQDAVVAITSGTPDMASVMQLVWKQIMPALQEKPLPPDKESWKMLQEKLSMLSIRPVQGLKISPEAPNISGKMYVLDSNDLDINSISFDFQSSPITITINSGGQNQKFAVGSGSIENGSMSITQLASDKIATSGAWSDSDQYVVNLIYYETPHVMRYTFDFKEDKLVWSSEWNVYFGSRKLEQLRGIIRQ